MNRRDDIANVKAMLLDRFEELALALFGNPRARSHRSWRYNNFGSLSVDRSKKVFYSFEENRGGSVYEMIQFANGGDFEKSFSWAKHWLGISDTKPAPVIDTAALIEKARKRAAAQAEAETDEARRIALARNYWNSSIPVAGTVAEKYLTDTRCIAAPPGGWPHDAVRFHPGTRALIVAARDDDGAVRATQRVRLTDDGVKIAAGNPQLLVKESNGVLTGAAVRLPGPADGPVLIAEGPETGITVWAATGYETRIQAGNITRADLPTDRRVIVCADDDREGSPAAKSLDAAVERWLTDAVDLAIARPWPERRGDKSDFNDAIRAGGTDAVRAAIDAASTPSTAPHYPRPRLAGDAASLRLRRIVAAWFDRVERHLDARDWIDAEAERILDDVCAAAEKRICAKLIKAGADPGEAADEAAERAFKAAPALAKRAARKAAAARFGHRAASGEMPRIQIKGAAGLGKTQAVIEEYLRRPGLWKRHVTVYTRTLELADDFANSLREAAAEVAPAPDGNRPRAIVIHGRGKGLCEKSRLKLVDDAVRAGCESIYRTCCHTPASGDLPESFCPFFHGCSYVAQFDDRKPALRVLAHQRIGLGQPTDIRLPKSDLIIVDESTIDAMTAHATIDPALLREPMTYAAPKGAEELIGDAIETGRRVADALAGNAEALATLEALGTTAKHLREAAEAAALGAEKSRPAVHAGMDTDAARDRLKRHKRHEGRAVAAVLTQLARDMDSQRRASTGIEFDAEHTVQTQDGGRVPHPIIRRHGVLPPLGAPGAVALLLLDADADLDINRQIFGASLKGFIIAAARRAHVTQICDHALATSSIAPGDNLPNNSSKAGRLRQRVTELVRRETATGARVLVMATLPVRRALSGETEPRAAISVSWNGADLSHFGRHLGVDGWRHHDAVVVIGREQVPPLAAERIARAIWADAPDVTLTLPGDYGKEMRRHDLRDGIAPRVEIQAHVDPRVQAIVEMHRENAIGQSVDRLRLIHRDPSRPARVIVLTNLPIPGLTVDRLDTLENVLAGGNVWQRALARMPGGVLPLSRKWISSNLLDLFGSERKAGREIEALISGHSAIDNIYCQVATFRIAGQRRHSKALHKVGTPDPRSELSRVMGAEIVEFRYESDAEKPVVPKRVSPEPPAADPAPEPANDCADIAPAAWFAPVLRLESLIGRHPPMPPEMLRAALLPPGIVLRGAA